MADAIVNLVGVAATSAAGALGPEVDSPLLGVAATGTAGSLVPNVRRTAVGPIGTGHAGSLAIATTAAFAGVSASGSAGALTPEADAALTGVSAAGLVGAVFGAQQYIAGVAAFGYAAPLLFTTAVLAGVAGSGAAGALTAASGPASLTGVSAAGAAGALSVDIASGTITANLTGVAATGQAGTLAASGSAGLTGVAAIGHAGIVTATITIPPPFVPPFVPPPPVIYWGLMEALPSAGRFVVFPSSPVTPPAVLVPSLITNVPTDGRTVSGLLARIAPKSTNYQIVAGDSGTYFTNAGASGTIALTLPPATPGLVFGFVVRAAAALNVVAAPGQMIALGVVLTSAGGYVQSSTVSSSLCLIATDQGAWETVTLAGTWVPH